MLPVPKFLCAGALAAALPILAPAPSVAQRPPPLAAAPAPPRYADYADLVLAAPVIADATIRGTSRIKGPEAAGVAPGHARFYVEATVVALIRGTAALPPKIGYLLDVPLDSRGKPPPLKKLRVLLFARAVAARPDQLQLVRPDAQRSWTPGADTLTRRITREAVAAAVPPAITGFANAFHVAGTLPGEGETQIFLTTADGRPVSLGVTRRAGAPPRWSVSLGDVVADDAAPPARDTLLWYRLACFLPPALPEAALAGTQPDDAALAREDYRFVMTSLGSCDRGFARQ